MHSELPECTVHITLQCVYPYACILYIYMCVCVRPSICIVCNKCSTHTARMIYIYNIYIYIIIIIIIVVIIITVIIIAIIIIVYYCYFIVTSIIILSYMND